MKDDAEAAPTRVPLAVQRAVHRALEAPALPTKLTTKQAELAHALAVAGLAEPAPEVADALAALAVSCGPRTVLGRPQ